MINQIANNTRLLRYILLRRIKVFIRWILSLIGFFDKEITVLTNFVFVVGCSHSGTTLLTTILGRNSQILALGNESYLFGQQYSAIKYGVKQWDIISQQLSKKVFVEKTPKHVYEIYRIFKFLPSCKVLFIVRNAEDNIASLYKRNNDLSFSVRKYISDNLVAMKFEKDSRVKKIFYEDLVSNPEEAVKNICDFINIKFEPEMNSKRTSVFENWGAMEEKPNPSLRSRQVVEPIINNIGKSRSRLNESELAFIHRKLDRYKLLHLTYDSVLKSLK